MTDSIHALSPYDGRYKDLGNELAPWFSEAGLMQARILVEIRYLLALSEEKIIRGITREEKQLLRKLESPDDTALKTIKEIEKVTNHDVQAVVVYLRDTLIKTSLSDVIQFIHFGLTSEDVNNLAWRLGLVGARDQKMIPAIDALLDRLCTLAETYKSLPMLARTHGQPAVPTTFGKELINFAFRLYREKNKMAAYRFSGKFGGAVGNFSALSVSYPDTDWVLFSGTFIRQLGFEPNHYTTQVNPNDDIVEYLQITDRINTILHGMAADMWRYISDDLVIQQSTGVGSSTMPQKINPIHFEHSEGVTEISSGLIGVLAGRLSESRLQRDLSDTVLFRFLGDIHASTLDALRRVSHSLAIIYPNEDAMRAMLWNNWVILAEPLQLLLRKAGITDAYAVVKSLMQGKKLTQGLWKESIDGLLKKSRITDRSVIRQIRALSPDKYLGYAVMLVDTGLSQIRRK